MNEPKMKQGEIADFGYDKYQGKDTFYLVLQKDGEKLPALRGKGLEEAFKKAGELKTGDAINLKDFGIDETSKKRIWEIEAHEPYQNLSNAIEHDVARERQKNIVADNDKTLKDEETVKDKGIKRLSDFEYELPDSIKNNYVAITKNRLMRDEKINYYDKADGDKVNIAFEDRKNSLNTSRQDEKTINAMMDLAESKGWTAIKLKGTEEFKQKAWLEASLRGIETKGYEPNEKDKAELIAKQELRTNNQVEATKVKEPQLKADEPTKADQSSEKSEENKSKEDGLLSKVYTKEKDKTTKDHTKDAMSAVAMDAGLALATGGKYTAGMAVASVVTDKVQSLVADKIVERTEKEKQKETQNVYDYNANGEARDPQIANDLRQMAEKSDAEIARKAQILSEMNKNPDVISIREALNNSTKNVPEQQWLNDAVNKRFDNTLVEMKEFANEHGKHYDFSSFDKAVKADLQDITNHLPNDVKDKVLQDYENVISKNNTEKVLTPTTTPTLDPKDVKKQIKEITQTGYRDGTISNREDLVNVLTKSGYEVVKENEKSIRLKIPNSDQHLTLKGEMFTKDFDAIRNLKENLEPEKIKERHPNISDISIAQITAWKDHVLNKYTTPQAQQEVLHRLDSNVNDIANGKDLGMPPIPANETQPDIEVRTPDSGERSRQR